MGRREKVVSCCDIERKIRYDDTRFRRAPISEDHLPFLEAIARNPRIRGSSLFKSNGTHVPDPYVFRVRCMGKLHKIIIWPDGAVTLTAHLGEVCKKRDEIYSWAGKAIGCREILKTWKNHCYGTKYDYLPTDVKKLAEDVDQWRKGRFRNGGQRWVSQRRKASFENHAVDIFGCSIESQEDELAGRIAILRRKLNDYSNSTVQKTCKEVFGKDWYWKQNAERRDGIAKFRNEIRYSYSVCLSMDYEKLRSKLNRLGLLQSGCNLVVNSPYPEREGEGTFHPIPVMPVRVLDYGPYISIVTPGNALLECIDKYGHLHLMEVQLVSKPGLRKRWRVAKTWPSREKLVQLK